MTTERSKRVRLATRFMTFGIILASWAALWLLYRAMPETVTVSTFIACGLIVTGVTFAVVGLRMGKIARDVNEDAATPPPPRATTPTPTPGRVRSSKA